MRDHIIRINFLKLFQVTLIIILRTDNFHIIRVKIQFLQKTSNHAHTIQENMKINHRIQIINLSYKFEKCTNRYIVIYKVTTKK